MSAVHIRYYITTFGCFERFMALCYPFKHKVNVAVRNIGKIMLLMALIMHLMNWSLCVIEYKVKEGKPLTDLISMVEGLATNSTNLPQLDSARAQPKGRGKEVSFGGNDNETSTDLSLKSNSTESGDEDVKNKAGLQRRLLSSLFFRYEVQLLPVVIVMMITIPLTVRELMRMRKASSSHSQDRGLVIAVIYILVITMISILCLIPLYILKNLKKYIPKGARKPFRFLHDGYGVLNIIIYGIMNKRYRNALRENLSKCRGKLRANIDNKIMPLNATRSTMGGSVPK